MTRLQIYVLVRRGFAPGVVAPLGRRRPSWRRARWRRAVLLWCWVQDELGERPRGTPARISQRPPQQTNLCCYPYCEDVRQAPRRNAEAVGQECHEEAQFWSFRIPILGRYPPLPQVGMPSPLRMRAAARRVAQSPLARKRKTQRKIGRTTFSPVQKLKFTPRRALGVEYMIFGPVGNRRCSQLLAA